MSRIGCLAKDFYQMNSNLFCDKDCINELDNSKDQRDDFHSNFHIDLKYRETIKS